MLKIAGRTKPYKVIDFTTETDEENNIVTDIFLEGKTLKLTIMQGETISEKNEIIRFLNEVFNYASLDYNTVILTSKKAGLYIYFEAKGDKQDKFYKTFFGKLE